MGRSSYSMRLFGEFVQFARERRVYWIVPLIGLLALAGAFVVTSETVAPLIYTLF
jgi:hypothetical protein